MTLLLFALKKCAVPACIRRTYLHLYDKRRDIVQVWRVRIGNLASPDPAEWGVKIQIRKEVTLAVPFILRNVTGSAFKSLLLSLRIKWEINSRLYSSFFFFFAFCLFYFFPPFLFIYLSKLEKLVIPWKRSEVLVSVKLHSLVLEPYF